MTYVSAKHLVSLTCKSCNETWGEMSRFPGFPHEIHQQYLDHENMIPCEKCEQTVGFEFVGICNVAAISKIKKVMFTP